MRVPYCVPCPRYTHLASLWVGREPRDHCRRPLSGPGPCHGMSVPCAVLAICCVLRIGFAQSPVPSPVPPLETGLVQTGPDDWGQDHVGKAFPPYVTGDECLFCHRDIGPNWGSNPHQLTLRPALPDLPAMTALSVSQPQQAAETRFLLGSSTHTRFLKRSQKYGQLELSNLRLDPDSASQLRMAQDMTASEVHWQADKFGEACAGCHCSILLCRGQI